MALSGMWGGQQTEASRGRLLWVMGESKEGGHAHL